MALKYFAYGSNMLSERLRRRIDSARVCAVACLSGYKLTFEQVGHTGDESGKCTIEETGQSGDKVYGVVYNMTPDEKLILDRYEGLGYAYGEKDITVHVPYRGETLTAFTYYGMKLDPSKIPFGWYRDFVLGGAVENNFPPDYIAMLRSVAVVEDPDAKRRAENQDILRTLGYEPGVPA